MEDQAPVNSNNTPNHGLQPKVVYTLLSIIIAVLVGGIAYLWMQQDNSTPTPVNSANTNTSYTETTTNTTVAATNTNVNSNVNTSATNTNAQIEKITDDVLAVKWAPALTQLPQDCKEYCESNKYTAGVIDEGEYKGYTLYLKEVLGLGVEYTHYILKNKVETPLGDSVKISGIHDIPKEITYPGSTYKLEKRYINTLFSKLTKVRKLFTDAKLGDVFLMDNGCIMAELPDHTAIAYDFVIPFVNQENGMVNASFAGVKNTEAYQYNRIIGCGALCYYLAEVKEADIKPATRLVQTGTTSTNEDFYLIKDPNDSVLKELYNDKNTVAYYSEGWQVQATSKYTYQQFIDYRPLMYWKDPVGRWIEFRNQRFILAAEMCKPVLYLYPITTTDLTVRVRPNGGFTYTDPKYDDGWLVRALPDGSLTNLKTGKQHPYLFWEGIGMNYPVEQRGWVVSQKTASAFFDTMLPKLGLQGREIRDFKEYWVGRLNESSYYQLTFLKKEQFDEIAPLGIQGGKPNSVIRVMMTATPMAQFAQILPQELPPTPARNGFTVVEWGGVVLK